MTQIHDQNPGHQRFPIAALIAAIQRGFAISGDETVRILCIGGAGPAIVRYELILDDGMPLSVTMCDIAALASAKDEYLDELYCQHDDVTFGIWDASFMFVQSADRKLEADVANCFISVRELPGVILRPKGARR